jgi:hypothetical protein
MITVAAVATAAIFLRQRGKSYQHQVSKTVHNIGVLLDAVEQDLLEALVQAQADGEIG